jgi:pimeloyl-ACP methyl ester carboxylesterase
MVSPTTSTESFASGAFGKQSGPFGDLYVEWSGPSDAPGVVILHGWGSSAEMMRILADGLAPTHRVANVDLPGHGRAGIPQEPIGVAGHAARVATLIRERFSSPVSIIGHSNGGRIALFMASDETISPLISSLVLIAPSGVKPRRKPSFYLKKYTAKILKLPFSILPGRLREFGLDWLRHSLVWRALGSSDYRRLSGVMRDIFVKTVTHHLDDRLGDIRVPTLVFRGDQDQDISQYQISVLESRIPDAGVVVLKSAGHYAHLDDPQTVLLATRHFLTTPSQGESQE